MNIRRLEYYEIVSVGDLVYVGANGDQGLREIVGPLGCTAGEYSYPIFRAESCGKTVPVPQSRAQAEAMILVASHYLKTAGDDK